MSKACKAKAKAGRMGGVKPPQTPGNTERARPALPLWLPGLCAVRAIMWWKMDGRWALSQNPLPDLFALLGQARHGSSGQWTLERGRIKRDGTLWKHSGTGWNVEKKNTQYFAPVFNHEMRFRRGPGDHRVTCQTIATVPAAGNEAWKDAKRQLVDDFAPSLVPLRKSDHKSPMPEFP